MARPLKEGLDYFELDCVLDDNFKLIQAEFGLKGFAIVVKLYQKIYGGRGYYCEWNDDVSLLFTSENGLTGGDLYLISEIIQACIKRDIFSKELYEKYGILTSRGIQKRYFRAVSRREFTDVKKEYLLIDVRKFRVSGDNNEVSGDNNSVNVDGNTQRREEKRREEKTREDKRREEERETFPFGTHNNVYLTQSEYDEIQKTYLYGDGVINRVSEYLIESGRDYKNHYTLLKKIGEEYPKWEDYEDKRRNAEN